MRAFMLAGARTSIRKRRLDRGYAGYRLQGVNINDKHIEVIVR